MSHQVKAGAQALFGKEWIACGGNTLLMALFPSSLQILAVSHSAGILKSGYRQTLASLLVLQHWGICKPSIPTSPLYVVTAVTVFFSQTGMSHLWFWICCFFISYWSSFTGRIIVSAHTYSVSTIYTEPRGRDWHRPNRPSVWQTWGGQCSGKCGWIPDTADSKWKGRLLWHRGKKDNPGLFQDHIQHLDM